ncbi:MAG TPA: mRNA surveillance protein Pelota, partial [Candidatus Thermoplasmatota archaeon]|nr:mRNA surveillance protein Pelota [Candidatus Thermoplasmatota archaeon]
EGQDVEVHKRTPLQPWHLQLVEEAVTATRRPRVLLLAIDDSEAQFGLLSSYGLQVLGSLPAHLAGKRFADGGSRKEVFYDEALRSLKLMRVPPDLPSLVVGPGWWREEFLAHARRKDPTLAAGVVTEGTSQGGRTGLQEALRSGLVARVQAGHRVQAETDLVEQLLARVAAGSGLAAYGPAEVAQAVQAGAVETLMVADSAARSGAHDALLRAAEATRAKVHLVSTSHEAGERLARMGGLAALLRFPLQA